MPQQTGDRGQGGGQPWHILDFAKCAVEQEIALLRSISV